MPILIRVPGSEEHCDRLAAQLGLPVAETEIRRFPDGETYCRIVTPMNRRKAILVSTLHNPDDKFLLLAFLAATARDLGASEVGLVTPYLSFMRQDIRFKDGEGVTSVYFAKMLSQTVDWLITVDPHLHRHHSLAPLYSIPTAIANAAQAIADWIKREVPRPMLVGPDAESEQWVAAIAKAVGAPMVVLEKTRRGDRDVSVSQPNAQWDGRTPVIVDDIISTGQTMLQAVEQVVRETSQRPICVGIHAVFADQVDAQLIAAGASKVVTTNTITHSTNAICVAETLARSVQRMLSGQR